MKKEKIRKKTNNSMPKNTRKQLIKKSSAKQKTTDAERPLRNKKLSISMVLAFLILFLLIVRLFWIEIVQGAEFKETAYKQQTINRIISPKRGTIYDSTGSKALAMSSRVDTVTINPGRIRYSNDKKVEPELVAKAFSDIFELDYTEVLEKVNSTSSVETIIKKVEQDKINQLKEWMSDNKVTAGINIDEDSKRSYPYGNLASSILGFCGTDNQGLWGLESTLNDILTGTPGKIVTSTNVAGQEIPDENKQYIAPQNGSNVVLTIDYNIQSVAEECLKQAVIDNGCINGGNAIIMNPETGDILAMANYPDYDLNSPYTPNEWLAEGWDELSSEEKTSKLYEMWRNKAASSTYEPGSTFKLITSAIALEEGITTPDVKNDFFCSGSYKVSDIPISCWAPSPHGGQSLTEALEHSCNPSFVQLGQRIGTSTFYRYLRAFGLFNTTNSLLYGESSSVMHAEEDMLPIDLATLSFGQRFTITPLQLITAVSAIVNDGILMQPRIVKQSINTDTNVVTNYDPVEVRQVISKETSEQVRNMMRSVVVDGTGKAVNIKGYSIGGKSGTSEPRYNAKDDGYVASFIGVAPTTDAKVVVLVTLYKPTGSMRQGGEIAAPVVNRIFTSILPYLGISSSDSTPTTTTNNSEVLLTDVRNKTVAEAEKILKNAGFRVHSSISTDKTTTLVSDQVPKPGVRLLKDSIIYLYTEDKNVHVSVSVPDLKGMTAEQAINSVKSKNLNLKTEGTGKVVINQDYLFGTQVEEGTIITVTMMDSVQGAY